MDTFLFSSIDCVRIDVSVVGFMNNAIGILDSGIGGVTVLKEILKLIPNYHYIYYSDSIHNPYGDKSKEEIIHYVDNIVKFFIHEGCKIIVFACNTATSITIDTMREKYKDIIFVGIEPAYKMVHDYSKNQKTLVMATPATLKSERFLNLYHHYDNQNTILLACPNLASLIENDKEEEILEYLKKVLPVNENIEVVVLGCTHYPLIKKEISQILGNVIFYDGGKGVAKRLKSILDSSKIMSTNRTSTIQFYDSSNSSFKEKRFYEILENE